VYGEVGNIGGTEMEGWLCTVRWEILEGLRWQAGCVW
jgi:hypothetical protein